MQPGGPVVILRNRETGFVEGVRALPLLLPPACSRLPSAASYQRQNLRNCYAKKRNYCTLLTLAYFHRIPGFDDKSGIHLLFLSPDPRPRRQGFDSGLRQMPHQEGIPRVFGRRWERGRLQNGETSCQLTGRKNPFLQNISSQYHLFS